MTSANLPNDSSATDEYGLKLYEDTVVSSVKTNLELDSQQSCCAEPPWFLWFLKSSWSSNTETAISPIDTRTPTKESTEDILLPASPNTPIEFHEHLWIGSPSITQEDFETFPSAGRIDSNSNVT